MTRSTKFLTIAQVAARLNVSYTHSGGVDCRKIVDNSYAYAPMNTFYNKLSTYKKIPAAAVRAARLSIAKDPDWDDPFCWHAVLGMGGGNEQRP